MTAMTQTGNAELLRIMTNPASVALIGASGSAGKLQSRPMRFMQQHGFRGQIYPVNPGHGRIFDQTAYPDLDAIDAPIEHAYILLNTDAAIAALQACADAGVKVVSMLADGFAEAGPQGVARQQRVAAIAREAGILLIGPNSTGLVDTRSGFSCTTNAAFASERLAVGRLAVLSQSGSLIGSIYSRGTARGIDFSTLVSVGNEAACSLGETGSLIVGDPGCDAIVLFMETIRNPDALAAFAKRAHELGKPVVCYMIGRSSEGQQLSVSHTGAMTGSTMAVGSFLRAAGIEQVRHFESLLEAPAALIETRLPAHRPRTATVLTTTGGGGAMVVDRLSEQGIGIAGCPADARTHLENQSIPLGRGKLIDVTLAGARYDIMKEVVTTLAGNPEIGVLIVAIGSSAQFQPELAVKPIIDAIAALRARSPSEEIAPVLAFPLPQADQSLQLLSEAGIPSFRTLDSCVESVAMLMARAMPELCDNRPPDSPRLGELLHAMAASPSTNPSTNPRVLNEVQSARLFAGLGIRQPPHLVIGIDDKVPDTGLPDFPVVAKLISSELPHKSDAGALVMNLTTPAELRAAIDVMKARVRTRQPGINLQGVLIQSQMSGVAEMLVGFSRDPLVGPVITVGFGGTATEIYQDVVCHPAPVSITVARRLLTELRAFPLLDGFRGSPPADQAALVEAIVAISSLSHVRAICEAEINPLLVGRQGEGVTMLDALLTLQTGDQHESA